VDQGRGATTVEIDGIHRTERDQQPGELDEVEAGVDTGATPIAAHGDQLTLADTERAARMPLGSDVGVELPSARREPFRIVVVHDHATSGDQQGTCLEQVPGGGGRELAAGRKDHGAVRLDVNAATSGAERAGDRLVRDEATADPDLSERPPGAAKKEARDNRLGSAARRAPLVKALCLLEADHPHARPVPRVDDGVDRRLRAVGQPDARQLVPSSVSSLVRHAARSLRQTAPARNPCSPSRESPRGRARPKMNAEVSQLAPMGKAILRHGRRRGAHLGRDDTTSNGAGAERVIRRISLAALLACLAGSLSGPSAASAQEALGAACPGPPQAIVSDQNSDTRMAQTFVPSMSGAVTRAEMEVDEVAGQTHGYIVQILAADGNGTPTNTVIAQTTAPDVPDGQSTLTATFATQAPVYAGQTYALALSRPGQYLGWDIRADSRACPGRFFYEEGGGPWNGTIPGFGPYGQSAPADALFRLFIEPVTCKGKPATIIGTPGNDKRKGTAGRDVIAGLGGKDKLSGRGGNDLICGGRGKDTLKGGKGNDKLYGQAGKDTLKGGPGRDKLKGGAGRDKQVQ
jgi:hemolysin type calcium-binding protein